MYLDSNLFVFALLDKTRRGDDTRKFLGELHEKQRAITSSLTFDEIMWVLIKNRKKHLLRTAIEGIYSIVNLEIVGVSPLIPILALELMEKYDIMPRDAFHAAVMQIKNEKEIVTDDKDFDRIDGIKRTWF
ncbi:MAG: type II toxin-antitoxin system VapC family toxin [Candidatus Geothermarchaeales archaeon]